MYRFTFVNTRESRNSLSTLVDNESTFFTEVSSIIRAMEQSHHSSHHSFLIFFLPEVVS